MSRERKISLERNTAETKISLSIDLDGTGKYQVDTGCGFLNHMLELFARHGRFDLTLKCDGDTQVDYHHTTEDIGIALGQAILFNVNASSGGLDVIAKIISKYTRADIGKAVTIAGMVTAVTSILVYDIGTLVVSVLGTYANGLAVDYFIDGFNRRKKICILSDEYERIQKYIMQELIRGVTIYTAKGGYDGKEKTELVTIMTPSEYKQLLNYLHRSEIQAFVTVYNVSQVIGKWNINGDRRKKSE